MDSKILVLDIETRPGVGYVWGLHGEFLSLDQLIDPGGIICVGAKWFGSKEAYCFSDWDNGHDEMIRKIYELYCQADAVVTFNGDKFDLPKLNGEFLKLRLPAPPPITSIDLRKLTKKLGFISGKLAFLVEHLNIGRKLKHEGFELWAKVIDGNEVAQRKMSRYCVRDVVLTERLYKRVRPYIKNHPHMGTIGSHTCGACGSSHVQKRGFYRTKSYLTQRLQCQSCGSWQLGTRKKV